MTWRWYYSGHRAHGHNAPRRMSQKQWKSRAAEIDRCNRVDCKHCMNHVRYGFLSQCTLTCACTAGMMSANATRNERWLNRVLRRHLRCVSAGLSRYRPLLRQQHRRLRRDFPSRGQTQQRLRLLRHNPGTPLAPPACVEDTSQLCRHPHGNSVWGMMLQNVAPSARAHCGLTTRGASHGG